MPRQSKTTSAGRSAFGPATAHESSDVAPTPPSRHARAHGGAAIAVGVRSVAPGTRARGPRVESGGGGTAHALRMRTPFFSSHLRAYRVAPPRPRLASGMSHVSRTPGSSPAPGSPGYEPRVGSVGPTASVTLSGPSFSASSAASSTPRAPPPTTSAVLALPISESTCAWSRARRATIVGAWRSSVIGASSPPAASTA